MWNFRSPHARQQPQVQTPSPNQQQQPVKQAAPPAKPAAPSTEKTHLLASEKPATPAAPSADKVEKVPPHVTQAEPSFPWEQVGTFVDAENPPPFNVLKAMNMDGANKIMTNYVVEKYYADLWWNCSLAVLTCVFSWVIARLGGGFFSLCFVLICASTVYRTEFRRFNRNLRDDMLRLSAIENLEEKTETMDWLNSFLSKFWVIYMPALSEMVLTQANTVMKDVATPPPIDN
ncbi:unnamed protein product [Ambrosiozyma monospora]|uniref:Unnamed protein product n=1 Tax=Ambrosiozyma monospora TaxID=43982 RepID=A0A9W6Z5R7_AMBMO|nr:unnamed protein product [Ambrosiozyma monospora]